MFTDQNWLFFATKSTSTPSPGSLLLLTVFATVCPRRSASRGSLLLPPIPTASSDGPPGGLPDLSTAAVGAGV